MSNLSIILYCVFLISCSSFDSGADDIEWIITNPDLLYIKCLDTNVIFKHEFYKGNVDSTYCYKKFYRQVAYIKENNFNLGFRVKRYGLNGIWDYLLSESSGNRYYAFKSNSTGKYLTVTLFLENEKWKIGSIINGLSSVKNEDGKNVELGGFD